MRWYGRFFKNIAAFCMLLALLVLLLPCCKVQTPEQTMTFSGWEVLQTGGKMTVQYLSKGSVDDTFVVKKPYTWADVKSGAQMLDQQNLTGRIIVLTSIVALPVLFCLLAMVMTFLAEGKKTMVLPTFLLLWIVLEYGGCIILLPQLKAFLLPGVYLFTALCTIALVILLLLWLTGGFRAPKNRKDRQSHQDRDRETDDGGRKHSRRRRHSSKRKKKKGRKKDRSRDSGKDSNENDKNKKEQNRQQEQKQAGTGMVTGQLCEGSGMYQGTTLAMTGQHSVTIGTTPEAVAGLRGGRLDQMAKVADQNCVIQYQREPGSYKIQSHSDTQLVLQDLQSGKTVLLNKGGHVSLNRPARLSIPGTEHSLTLK